MGTRGHHPKFHQVFGHLRQLESGLVKKAPAMMTTAKVMTLPRLRLHLRLMKWHHHQSANEALLFLMPKFGDSGHQYTKKSYFIRYTCFELVGGMASDGAREGLSLSLVQPLAVRLSLCNACACPPEMCSFPLHCRRCQSGMESAARL